MEFELKYNPKIKGLQLTSDEPVVSPQFKRELDQLNTLCTELLGITAPVPPKPAQENFNKDLSKMIKKLYESGVQLFKQGKFSELARQFSIAIEIVNRRNKFEAFQGTLQELCLLLMSRADAYLKIKEYLKAFNDADMLIGMMMNTPDNFLRRGVANFFLGNYEDARADYQRGLSFDESNERLLTELNICLDKILEENGDYL